MLLRYLWTPSHALTWTPRAGVVRSWFVHVVATAIEGGPALVAQTAEEDRKGESLAWIYFQDAETWTWRGRPGYGGGEAGAVTVERLED